MQAFAPREEGIKVVLMEGRTGNSRSVDVRDGEATLRSGSTYRGTRCETFDPPEICVP